MKSYIGIRLIVEGLHNFPQVVEVFGDEVEYLKYPHRHLFYIECEFEVNDLDREREFIKEKHSIINYINRQYWDANKQCANFGAMSCEMIAKELIDQYSTMTQCIVSEDGENYAKLVR